MRLPAYSECFMYHKCQWFRMFTEAVSFFFWCFVSLQEVGLETPSGRGGAGGGAGGAGMPPGRCGDADGLGPARPDGRPDRTGDGRCR